jgi:hypothetical protein
MLAGFNQMDVSRLSTSRTRSTGLVYCGDPSAPAETDARQPHAMITTRSPGSIPA